MSSKATLKLAKELLDRFFRDAEGRTNRQLDVYFTLEDMSVSRDKAEPALEYLAGRGLLNTFGPDIAFLTDEGCRAAAEDVDLEQIPKVVRDFEQVPRTESLPEPTEDLVSPDAAGAPGKARPDRPILTHVDEDGTDRVVDLAWVCSVGRAEGNQVRIQDKRASKHHAEIRYEDGRYVLHDLESANGTLLNGEYVVEPVPIDHDDEIVIGRTLLLYQCPEAIPRPAGTPPDTAPPERAATPPPDLAFVERPGFGDPTPIPPSIPIFPGRPTGPESPRSLFEAEAPEELPERDLDVFASDGQIPEALLEGQPDPAEAAPPFEDEPDPATLPGPQVGSTYDPEPEILDPEALIPLEGPEGVQIGGDALDPADPGHPEVEPEAFADTVRSVTRPEEPEEAATIMTTREALFGAGPLPGVQAPEPTDAPPEVEPEAEPDPVEPLEETDPSLPVEADDDGVEPALITLLGHVRESLMRDPHVADRDRLLGAVDLLRGHPDLVRLARAIEDEFSDV